MICNRLQCLGLWLLVPLMFGLPAMAQESDENKEEETEHYDDDGHSADDEEEEISFRCHLGHLKLHLEGISMFWMAFTAFLFTSFVKADTKNARPPEANARSRRREPARSKRDQTMLRLAVS